MVCVGVVAAIIAFWVIGGVLSFVFVIVKIAVILALGYYFFTTMVGWLDQHPEYRPDLLLWAPNIFFLALGAWLLRRLDRT